MTDLPDAPAADAAPAEPVMRRYRMTVTYDGSDFCGWQEQRPPTGEPLRTVQGVLTATMHRVLGQPVVIRGASRTDSRVHAIGQVAHFDAATRIPLHRLAKAINSRLPEDVEVRDVVPVDPAFDAISHAIAKQYRYRIWTSPHRPLHLRRAVWHCWTPLDRSAMADAAARLEGEHDFAAFAAAGHGRQSTVRRIDRCEVIPSPGDPVLSEGELHVVVSGNGFLYNMVRIIVGTLTEIGRGRWGPEHIDTLLADRDRANAGPTAPPQGLILQWVRYPGDA